MEMRDGGGGCCVAMYGRGGVAGDAGDVACKMGRIMLRFRPIAPKPATGPAAELCAAGRARGGYCRRSKRKSGSSDGGSRGRKTKKMVTDLTTAAVAAPPSKESTGNESSLSPLPSPSSSSSTGTASAASNLSCTVTLHLMPEKPELKEEKLEPTAPMSPPSDLPYAPPLWFQQSSQEVVVPRPVRPAGSRVTVQCVTETWHEGEVEAAATVGAVRQALLDTNAACPVFITDQWDRVTWTNEAYRRMVVGPPFDAVAPPAPEEEVKVGLVTRGLVPAADTCRAFACLVGVTYASRRRGKGSLAAPCDIWRLDDGRCAWRLDTTAALSLSNM